MSIKISGKLVGRVEVLMKPSEFPCSLSNVEIISPILEKIHNEIKTDTLFAINGVKHTTSISEFNGSNISDGVNALPEGIDGVFVTDLKGVSKKISIILGTADCAPILGATKDGNSIFNLHGGYKGILGISDKGTGIIGQLQDKLFDHDILHDSVSIFVGPMVGSNFEIERNMIDNISKDFFIKHSSLRIDTYLKNIRKKGKVNFNLSLLIKDIFEYYGFKNVKFSGIETNDISNNWNSYRLAQKKLQKVDGRNSATISNII